MTPALLAQLRCPTTRAPLEVERVIERDGDRIEHGILRSPGHRFPVVAGIPVLALDAAAVGALRALERGRPAAALARLVAASAPVPRSRRIVRRLLSRGPLHALVVARTRRRAEHVLGAEPPTAERLLAFSCVPPGAGSRENFNYFYYRFSQPRYLVGLAFARLVDRPASPVLDLACGPGQLTRYLARRARPTPVVGVDRTFALLHVARRVTAPEAEFVCADATAVLPFRDAVFSFVFCSDAFHYFGPKEHVAREMQRVSAPGAAIALITVRNANTKHLSAGAPLTPAGYAALFADRPWRVLAEDVVLQRYLERRPPPLATATSLDEVAGAPNVALVASEDTAVFAERAPWREWPHGEGPLAINPLYRVERSGPEVTLRRAYPSVYYEQEHEEGRVYLPPAVSTTAEAVAAVGRGERTPEVERLVDAFVALGMPPRWGAAAAS